MRKRLIFLVIFLEFVIGFIIGYFNFCAAQMKISMLDIGQGDSIFIQTDTQNILVDTGDVNMRANLLANLKNISRIDKLILTHPHSDHIGNAPYLLSNFYVQAVYDNGQISTSKYYLNYLKLCTQKNISHYSIKSGDKIDLDEGYIEFFNPNLDLDINNNSLVFKLVYNEFSMLFTGDIGFAAEADILKRECDIKSKVLKAAHHGSKTSSSYNFVQAAKPQVVLISAGKNNKFKHPTPTAIKSFLSTTDKIFCTAFNGTIMIETDGNSFSIEPQFNSDWLKKVELPNEVVTVRRID